MREIVVISGKGGTGKTSLTACLAHLAQDAIICDLDVDAPDLHLLLHPEVKKEEVFVSGHEAVIDPKRCEGCGLCAEMCRFGAVSRIGDTYLVNPLHCEGCKVCVAVCPVQAIDFPDRDCGHWYVSDTRFGPMVHAQLAPGEENSGLLVTLLKKKARALAAEYGSDLVLCDGAPGIGCPVISSLAGTDLAVLVTEPTPSGRHDLERVVDLCHHFRVKTGVIINKNDLNLDQSSNIMDFCLSRDIPVLACLPHDPVMTLSMVQGKAVTEEPSSEMGGLLREAWQRIVSLAWQDAETPASGNT